MLQFGGEAKLRGREANWNLLLDLTRSLDEGLLIEPLPEFGQSCLLVYPFIWTGLIEMKPAGSRNNPKEYAVVP